MPWLALVPGAFGLITTPPSSVLSYWCQRPANQNLADADPCNSTHYAVRSTHYSSNAPNKSSRLRIPDTWSRKAFSDPLWARNWRIQGPMGSTEAGLVA